MAVLLVKHVGLDCFREPFVFVICVMTLDKPSGGAVLFLKTSEVA